MTNETKNNVAGFTLIEILAVIGIGLILLGIVTASLFKMSQKKILEKDALAVISIIDRAKTFSQTSKNGTQYGIHFEENKVVLFEGSSYVSGSPGNEEYLISPKVRIGDIVLAGGGFEVVFGKNTGRTNQFGTLIVSLRSGSAENYSISVYNTGLIETTPSLIPSSSPAP